MWSLTSHRNVEIRFHWVSYKIGFQLRCFLRWGSKLLKVKCEKKYRSKENCEKCYLFSKWLSVSRVAHTPHLPAWLQEWHFFHGSDKETEHWKLHVQETLKDDFNSPSPSAGFVQDWECPNLMTVVWVRHERKIM